jgi:hypothetical protein
MLHKTSNINMYFPKQFYYNITFKKSHQLNVTSDFFLHGLFSQTRFASAGDDGIIVVWNAQVSTN